MERKSLLGRVVTLGILALALCPPAQAQYGGGTGTPNDPYLIYTAEQLNTIGLRGPMNAHYRLMADIDLGVYPGTGFNTIGHCDWAFHGTFDGNGHSISNFAQDKAFQASGGLFGCVGGPEAEIRNVRLVDPNIYLAAGLWVGVLVGNLEGGVIRNCSVERGQVVNYGDVGLTAGLVGWSLGNIVNCQTSCRIIATTWAGGLVGEQFEGEIIACSATGAVEGDYCVGGLVGSSYSYSFDGEVRGILAHCYATGDVDGNDCVGGLVGDSLEGVLTDCYATGKVDGRNRVGGLLGSSSEVTVKTSYASGAVTGRERVGGLVGNLSGTVAHCYATGNVSGVAYVGGLVGRQSGSRRLSTATIEDSLSTGIVMGESGTGGLVGDGPEDGAVSSFWDIQRSGQPTSASGQGITTAAMQDPNTFIAAGWDFFGPGDGPSDIWTIDPISGYPILWWQVSESELPQLPPFSGGEGTAKDPYLIASVQQLNSIGHNPRLMDAHFRLTAGIDLAGVEFAIIGSTAIPFSGTLDGDGWTVSNFTYVSEGEDHVALVGYAAGAQAEIQNLILVDPNVNAGTTDCVG